MNNATSGIPSNVCCNVCYTRGGQQWSPHLTQAIWFCVKARHWATVDKVWVDPDQIAVLEITRRSSTNLNQGSRAMVQLVWVFGTHFGNPLCLLEKKKVVSLFYVATRVGGSESPKTPFDSFPARKNEISLSKMEYICTQINRTRSYLGKVTKNKVQNYH